MYYLRFQVVKGVVGEYSKVAPMHGNSRQTEFIPNNAQNTSILRQNLSLAFFCLYVHKECLSNQWRFWSKKFVTLYKGNVRNQYSNE